MKTAYEWRMSDWSSDVCSSDLALVELAIAGDQQSAFAIAAQTEIENAGDRIRSIERRRAVTQNLQLADRDRRNRRKIGSLRSPDIGNIGELDRRAAMAPFAVHEHQRLVRRQAARSEEHTSELQSLMRISYAVFCLIRNNNNIRTHSRRL